MYFNVNKIILNIINENNNNNFFIKFFLKNLMKKLKLNENFIEKKFVLKIFIMI